MSLAPMNGLDMPPFDQSEGRPPAAWGFQAVVRFQPGAVGQPERDKETQAIDAQDDRSVRMWRVAARNQAVPTASGPRFIGRLIYGTSASIELDNLIGPIVAYVPGNVQLYVRPEDEPLTTAFNVSVSLKPVGGYSIPFVRTFHDFAVAGAVPLPQSGARFVALNNASVTVEGISVALTAGDTLPITNGSVLTAGAGLVEHEL